MALTYESIATTTLGTNAADITFTSISGSYTDLILVGNFALASASNALNLNFNSDSGSNYSVTSLYGDGSAAASVRATNRTAALVSYYVDASGTVGESNIVCHIQNYSNSTTYKTVLSRMNRATANNFPGAEATVTMWRSTNAITSIKVSAAANLVSGSTFTLYGIKSF